MVRATATIFTTTACTFSMVRRRARWCWLRQWLQLSYQGKPAADWRQMATFSIAAYRKELQDLLADAVAAWRGLGAERPRIFTVSVWTDPEAACSAVSIDTRENSDVRVRETNAYNRARYDHFVQEGDLDMAALF